MTASLILAAGRGSRMKGFEGNKTLLPLIPDKSPFEGNRPILLEILKNLPDGPKILVVHHKKETVMDATRNLGLHYCEQPELNGTGGALLAAWDLLEKQDFQYLIITMGDVPLVKPETYTALVEKLKVAALVVLGFKPREKKQYGLLDIDDRRVQNIIEWKYWHTFPEDRQKALEICNSGIYAVRKPELLKMLPALASRPHVVSKEIGGRPTDFNEYFITDLVEIMNNAGLPVEYGLADTEDEVMGIDDLSALLKAQEIFKKRQSE